MAASEAVGSSSIKQSQHIIQAPTLNLKDIP